MPIDHMTIKVPKDKFDDVVEFYAKVLARLGYTKGPSFPGVASMLVDGYPDFWIMGKEGTGQSDTHYSFRCKGGGFFRLFLYFFGVICYLFASFLISLSLTFGHMFADSFWLHLVDLRANIRDDKYQTVRPLGTRMRMRWTLELRATANLGLDRASCQATLPPFSLIPWGTMSSLRRIMSEVLLREAAKGNWGYFHILHGSMKLESSLLSYMKFTLD